MGRPKGSKNLVPGTGKYAASKTTKRERHLRAKRSAKSRRINELAAQAASVEAEDREVAKIQAKIEQPSPEQQIYEQFKANPLLWARFYCPRHFRLKSPVFHLDLLRAALKYRHLAVAAPRESSKSTLLAFVYPFHGICFKRFRFIVILSNTFKKGAMALETMKQELRDNEKLLASFVKPPVITKDAEGDSEFRHPDGFMTKVLCKGSDQIGSIRGVKFGAWRPDLIIVDDVEDDEMVKNPIRRQDLQQVVDEALIPAGEAGGCQYIWIGTILHDDSQLAKMVKHETMYPEYTKMIYQAHMNIDTDRETSLWLEKWSTEDLRRLMADKPLVYAKEYQNDPVAGLAGAFHKDQFRYWRKEGEMYVLLGEDGQQVSRGYLRWCKAAIACDLAWSEKRRADFCVIMPGFLTPTSELLVDNYFARKGVRPNEVEEILFTWSARLKILTGGYVPIGFEKAQLEKVVRWILREAMKRRNEALSLQDLLWDGDKITRVETRLQGRYAAGMIYHQHGMGELEHQLVRFPSSTHNDLPDALQGLVQLLKKPKLMREQKPVMDRFEIMRRVAIASRRPTKGLGTLQGLNNKEIIPAKVSWLE